MKRLAVAVLTVAGSLAAQTTGTVSGTVQDATGAVVPGATVTATNTGTNQSRAAMSDGAGQYVLPLLPLGEYNLRFEKEGFAPFVQEGACGFRRTPRFRRTRHSRFAPAPNR